LVVGVQQFTKQDSILVAVTLGILLSIPLLVAAVYGLINDHIAARHCIDAREHEPHGGIRFLANCQSAKETASNVSWQFENPNRCVR
jgi:hypothetical protein